VNFLWNEESVRSIWNIELNIPLMVWLTSIPFLVLFASYSYLSLGQVLIHHYFSSKLCAVMHDNE